MAAVDTTIVNAALGTLSRGTAAPLSTIQWVSTGYLLAPAVGDPLSGWLTERFGSKRTWINSIALFATGSGLCASATSTGVATALDDTFLSALLIALLTVPPAGALIHVERIHWGKPTNPTPETTERTDNPRAHPA
jgi:MFS family permease